MPEGAVVDGGGARGSVVLMVMEPRLSGLRRAMGTVEPRPNAVSYARTSGSEVVSGEEG